MITNSLDVTKYNVDLLLVLDIVRMRRAMLTCILPTVIFTIYKNIQLWMWYEKDIDSSQQEFKARMFTKSGRTEYMIT